MRKAAIIIIAVMLGLAWLFPPEEPKAPAPPPPPPKTAIELKRDTVRLMKKPMRDFFQISEAKASLPIDDTHLWGKFFGNRVEFHIDENPDLVFHNAKVEEVMLCFIDSTLCKKKYRLKKDVSNQLVMHLGKCSFTPMNWETQKLVDSLGVYVIHNKKAYLNPDLKDFRLKWQIDDKVVKYQRISYPDGDVIIYEEELPGYKRLFRTVERELI